MNIIEKARFRNDVIRRFLITGQKRNVINLNAHNTFLHEFTKFKICFRLKRDNKEFITEASLIGGGIADIIVLDECKIIEVLVSETELKFKEKIKKYPTGLTVEYLRV